MCTRAMKQWWQDALSQIEHSLCKEEARMSTGGLESGAGLGAGSEM